MLSIEMFIFGSYSTPTGEDDYDVTSSKVEELTCYLLNKTFKCHDFNIEDTGAGHSNDHKFVIDLGDDLFVIENGIKKLSKLLSNKPFTYSKIKYTTIEQVSIYICGPNSQYHIFDWSSF